MVVTSFLLVSLGFVNRWKEVGGGGGAASTYRKVSVPLLGFVVESSRRDLITAAESPRREVVNG